MLDCDHRPENKDLNDEDLNDLIVDDIDLILREHLNSVQHNPDLSSNTEHELFESHMDNIAKPKYFDSFNNGLIANILKCADSNSKATTADHLLPKELSSNISSSVDLHNGSVFDIRTGEAYLESSTTVDTGFSSNKCEISDETGAVAPKSKNQYLDPDLDYFKNFEMNYDVNSETVDMYDLAVQSPSIAPNRLLTKSTSTTSPSDEFNILENPGVTLLSSTSSKASDNQLVQKSNDLNNCFQEFQRHHESFVNIERIHQSLNEISGSRETKHRKLRQNPNPESYIEKCSPECNGEDKQKKLDDNKNTELVDRNVLFELLNPTNKSQFYDMTFQTSKSLFDILTSNCKHEAKRKEVSLKKFETYKTEVLETQQSNEENILLLENTLPKVFESIDSLSKIEKCNHRCDGCFKVSKNAYGCSRKIIPLLPNLKLFKEYNTPNGYDLRFAERFGDQRYNYIESEIRTKYDPAVKRYLNDVQINSKGKRLKRDYPSLCPFCKISDNKPFDSLFYERNNSCYRGHLINTHGVNSSGDFAKLPTSGFVCYKLGKNSWSETLGFKCPYSDCQQCFLRGDKSHGFHEYIRHWNRFHLE